MIVAHKLNLQDLTSDIHVESKPDTEPAQVAQQFQYLPKSYSCSCLKNVLFDYGNSGWRKTRVAKQVIYRQVL
jgi:hypothetical protein